MLFHVCLLYGKKHKKGIGREVLTNCLALFIIYLFIVLYSCLFIDWVFSVN